ncbi:host cell division inhibitor Icd-like protein [Enterobacter hormaechei]|nr:host cell division inhibitor Icd-like protein [Enterobacter hormaechei]ELC6327383.1 host cell division inhibitor Icd-like protein [Enterobacter hormaechei]ELC6591765.1 host cell division inhibitor Icd-like protein [Enterobacter hormaechei]ELC6592378.1 host cell division inhibitor Icd-like protein [Enterobacter hormaechei]
MLNAAVQNKAFPLAGLMCTLRGIVHAHEGKAGITVPANASSSFSRRGNEESFETSTRTGLFAPVRAREEGFSDITTRGGNHSTGGSFRRSTRVREGEFLESIKKGLPTIANPVYGYSAPAKSGAGIGVPVIIRAHNTRHACFFVPRSYTPSMVDCMGAEQSAPVSLIPGYANPVQFTTSEIGVSGGGYQDHESEAAAMLATIPTQNPQFIWLIAAVRRDMPTITAKIHHIAAESEREARRTLSRDHVCFFAGRIRLEVAA